MQVSVRIAGRKFAYGRSKLICASSLMFLSLNGVCISIYGWLSVCVWICMCVCARMCMSVCVCVCIYVHVAVH